MTRPLHVRHDRSQRGDVRYVRSLYVIVLHLPRLFRQMMQHFVIIKHTSTSGITGLSHLVLSFLVSKKDTGGGRRVDGGKIILRDYLRACSTSSHKELCEPGSLTSFFFKRQADGEKSQLHIPKLRLKAYFVLILLRRTRGTGEGRDCFHALTLHPTEERPLARQTWGRSLKVLSCYSALPFFPQSPGRFSKVTKGPKCKMLEQIRRSGWQMGLAHIELLHSDGLKGPVSL